MLSFVAGSLMIQPQPSQAATGLGLVAAPTMTLTSSTSMVVLDIAPTATGALASGSHILTAATNVPAGYSLDISTPSAPTLATTTGTPALPTTLQNNTWGYAVPGTAGFDPTYATPIPTTTSKWANPTTNTTIKTTTNSTTSHPETADTTIYYAAKVDVSQPSGIYDNAVRYTAAANVASLPVPNIVSITPDSGDIAGGTTITIVGTGFTVNDQSVTTAVTVDGQACQNPSISSNTPTTGQDTITCTTPAHPAETVDVSIVTWGGSDTEAGGYRYKLPAVPMQEVTMSSCTTTRTLAYDVRDNATYWIQKMADGRCWMLTNLAYGGGGTDTYGDAKTINLNSTNTGATYTSPDYYIPSNSNRTTNPTDPSTSTDGGATNPQYGYLYNWCAAMGAQINTSACTSVAAPSLLDQNISICPAGWRLPTASSGSEFQQLTDAIGATTNGASGGAAGSLSLRVAWLAQYNGFWAGGNGFISVGSNGEFWSSTQFGDSSAYLVSLNSSSVSTSSSSAKTPGRAVRCILDIPIMQEMSIDECTNKRVMAYDARDNRTYWVQKMADGKCWMLTNLAYGGGGTNTYGDTKAITNSETLELTQPYYMIPLGANVTNYPSYSAGTTNYGVPSTSMDGTGQYGYLYNWCAAMGAQTATAACVNATTPLPDQNISICPAGWRLPTSRSSGEFAALNAAVNSGSTDPDVGLRSTWLAMHGGYWNSGFKDTGLSGYYWASTQNTAVTAYTLLFYDLNVNSSYEVTKDFGFTVRCIMADPPVETGDDIQTVNTINCPAVRTRVVDARDDASYWVQKMADGRCWMLTNLAYGGGGTNTYGDVKTITNSNTLDYTQSYYMIPTGSNRTTGTTDPSTSTDGGATNPQYGYLYNWCAAMGTQTSTSACANATTPLPDQNISICPAGWRLPTSNTGGEYQTLTDAIGATNNAAGSTSLRSAWLAQYSGGWNNGFSSQGSYGYFWSSTQSSSNDAYYLNFSSSYVNPSSNNYKYRGRAVRCISS